jgi:uncharacterized protein
LLLQLKTTMRIKLTDAERLILSNQYEILGELNDDEGCRRKAEQLRNGHEWLYGDFQSVAPPMSSEDAEYVLEVLGMFSDLSASYDKLPDKSGIEAHDVRFVGFDGNNESEFYSFSAALTENGNFTDTIGKTAKNSHMPTTELYRRLLKKYRELGSPRYPIPKTQIAQIVAERIHPENRK